MYTTDRKVSGHLTRNHEMEQNRIQRLLDSEYTDFSDSIIVESPFAETTRNGRGIRQISLGLTSTKLIIAADVFKGNCEFFCPRDLDPSIESFELISVYPLQYVTLSVYNRRRRKTLKARFVDGTTRYYEFAGMRNRKLLWRNWCEQVENLLSAKVEGSSLSETTAESSSSSTTLYILSSEIEIRRDIKNEGKRTVYRVWAHYGGAGDYVPPTWPKKDLYLGPSYDELANGQYAPIPVRFADASLEDIKHELRDLSPKKSEKVSSSWPTCLCPRDKRLPNGGLCDVLFIRDHDRKYFNAKKFSMACQSCPCSRFQSKIVDEEKAQEQRHIWYDSSTKKEKPKSPKKYLTQRISRFGFGVPEKCHSGLVLGPTRMERERLKATKSKEKSMMNLYVQLESGVKVWEGDGKGRCKSLKRYRHFRRYGLCTTAHFLYSLGPWSVQPGERTLLQGRRSFSLVTIRRQPSDSELKLPVSRRQLAASISHTALQSGRFGSIGTVAKGRVILFWTPEYWYRPRPASAAYRELRQHLNHLRNFRQEKEQPMKRRLFHRRKKGQYDEESIIVEEKPSFLERIFSSNGSSKKKKVEEQEHDATAQLRRLLRMDFRITIWDIDSTILASQLTLIDRDLFVRIPTEEIEILVYQRTSRNAPNLAAWIAFSHRVSCLTVSEILAMKKLAMRSRIIARLINAANKCFAMGNFHSCWSILAGLQAPPIYRLRSSWSYLRTHHANRYEIMERLCKIYKSPCTSVYRRAWTKAERDPPCMPHVGDLLARLLRLNAADFHRQQSNRTNNQIIRSKHTRFDNIQPVDANNGASSLKNNQESEQKQGFGKRIFESVLTKIKGDQRTIYEEKTDLSWTSKEQDLAWKYFYRWNNIILQRKAHTAEQQRLRNMDSRMKRVLDVASWLMDCQRRAMGYDFPGHSFTCEFLLKTRYREDRENFFISQKLEPPMIT